MNTIVRDSAPGKGLVKIPLLSYSL